MEGESVVALLLRTPVRRHPLGPHLEEGQDGGWLVVVLVVVMTVVVKVMTVIR